MNDQGKTLIIDGDKLMAVDKLTRKITREIDALAGRAIQALLRHVQAANDGQAKLTITIDAARPPRKNALDGMTYQAGWKAEHKDADADKLPVKSFDPNQPELFEDEEDKGAV